MSLGERFRAAREERGETLSEVAEHLRIRSVYLAAIEDENWSAIGAPVYTRGFLRTYARHLGLDAEEAVAEYNGATGSSAPAIPTAAPGAARPEPRSMAPLLWIAGAVALALIGFVIYLYVAPSGPPGAASAPAVASPTAPAGNAVAATTAPLAQTQTLAIRLTAPSWLRVTVDGNVSIEGTFPAGTMKSFHGRNALVRVGNAGGVHISVNGRPIGTLGGPGDVAERSFAL